MLLLPLSWRVRISCVVQHNPLHINDVKYVYRLLPYELFTVLISSEAFSPSALPLSCLWPTNSALNGINVNMLRCSYFFHNSTNIWFKFHFYSYHYSSFFFSLLLFILLPHSPSLLDSCLFYYSFLENAM